MVEISQPEEFSPTEEDFQVTNPHNVNGRMTYDVKGMDEKGPFEVKRRYNDFSLLHEKLTERWPGINIPPIPTKNMVEDSKNLFTGPSD